LWHFDEWNDSNVKIGIQHDGAGAPLIILTQPALRELEANGNVIVWERLAMSLSNKTLKIPTSAT
jgi:hypothetical protein